MKKLVSLAALVVALAIPAAGSAAPQAATCSNLGYLNAIQKANIKAMYANDLAQSQLFREAATAFGQAVRVADRAPLPCSAAMRGVRSTYRSGMYDWYLGARAWAQGSLSYGTRIYKRGTAKVNYATAQLKLINEG